MRARSRQIPNLNSFQETLSRIVPVANKRAWRVRWIFQRDGEQPHFSGASAGCGGARGGWAHTLKPRWRRRRLAAAARDGVSPLPLTALGRGAVRIAAGHAGSNVLLDAILRKGIAEAVLRQRLHAGDGLGQKFRWQ